MINEANCGWFVASENCEELAKKIIEIWNNLKKRTKLLLKQWKRMDQTKP